MNIARLARMIITTGIVAMQGTLAYAQGADTAAAEAVIKANKCAKCHAVDRKKDGPSYQEIAKKYKGKADAEDKMVRHLTSSPKVKIDGVEEEHKDIKAKNEAEIRAVVKYILSR